MQPHGQAAQQILIIRDSYDYPAGQKWLGMGQQMAGLKINMVSLLTEVHIDFHNLQDSQPR